jgi:PAS domain S-box-containing protein
VSTDAKAKQTLRAENAELRARLGEAEQTLSAIRSGEVDALVVGEQIYMLESADAASNRFRGEVLAQVNDVVIAVDNDNRVTYLNPAAERQYGFDASEVLGASLDEVVHYRWLRPEDEAAAQKALGQHGVWRGGNIHVKRDGEEVHVESTVNVLRDGGGAVVGLMAVIRDITERKCAEERLRESERRLQKAIEIETVGVIFFNMAGEFTGANEAFARMSGFSRGVMSSGEITWQDLTPPEWMRRSHEAFAELKATGRTTPYEKEYFRRDGSRFWGLFAASMIGETEAVEYVVEVSERRSAEEALRQAHNLLEQRVEERTRELRALTAELRGEIEERTAAEARVRELLRRLVNVQEEERRRIARDIHDQMGQQMTALRMNLESLLAKCDGQTELAEQSARTLALAEELDQSVDFLTWELRPTALDHFGLSAALANLVRGWSERFRLPAEYHASGVDNLRLPHDAEINLYRLVQEALHNVYKHAVATSVGVFFERRDDHAVFIIADDGRGFDPYGVSEGDDGDRVGLVGMRERATLVGGELEMESSPGEGTTIYVRVPLKKGTVGDN